MRWRIRGTANTGGRRVWRRRISSSDEGGIALGLRGIDGIPGLRAGDAFGAVDRTRIAGNASRRSRANGLPRGAEMASAGGHGDLGPDAVWGARPGFSVAAGDGLLPEGLLIWLEADTIIRQGTRGGKSLDDFCRKFHGGDSGAPKVVTYTMDDVVLDLEQRGVLRLAAVFPATGL